MKPTVTIIPNDLVDEQFAKIATKMLQYDFDLIPDRLWLCAYNDIASHGHISISTEQAILNHFKASG